MKDQYCWNICNTCHVPCSVLTDTTVSLSSPELGCSCTSSLCCRGVSIQQVDYCVSFPSQIGSASPPSGAGKQISQLWERSEERRESCASRGRLIFLAGREGSCMTTAAAAPAVGWCPGGGVGQPEEIRSLGT